MTPHRLGFVSVWKIVMVYLPILTSQTPVRTKDVSTEIPFIYIFKHLSVLLPIAPADCAQCTVVMFYDAKSLTRLPTLFDSPKLLAFSPRSLKSANKNMKHSAHCSVVTYLQPSVSHQLDNLDENWQALIPGSIFRSFHFFAEDEVPSVDFVRNPFMRRLGNSLILVKVHNRRWEMMEPNRFGGTPPSVRVGILTESRIESVQNSPCGAYGCQFFRNKWVDVNGENLIVAVPPTQSRITLTSFLEHGVYNYPVVEIAEAVRLLNGTPDVIRTDFSHGFGRKLSNGSWDSYIGKVYTDQVTFSAPFFPNHIQFEVVLFSKPVMFSQAKFLTPLPRRTAVDIKFLIEPFDKFIWAGLIMGVILNGLSVHALQAFGHSNSGKRNWLHFWLSLEQNCKNFVQLLVEQSLESKILRTQYGSAGLRAVFLMWLLVVIVIVPLYKSIVIAVLVQPVYVEPPLTIEELVKSDFRVNILFYKSIMEPALPWTKNLKTPPVDFGMDFRGCLQTLLRGKNVCLFVLHWLYLMAPIDLIDMSGRRLFLVSKEAANSFGSHFCISQKNPQLKVALDRVANSIVESGFSRLWIAAEFNQKAIRTIRQKRQNSTTKLSEEELVDDKLLRYPLLVAAIGLLVSAISCVLEALTSQWARSRNKVDEVTTYQSILETDHNDRRTPCLAVFKEYECRHLNLGDLKFQPFICKACTLPGTTEEIVDQIRPASSHPSPIL